MRAPAVALAVALALLAGLPVSPGAQAAGGAFVNIVSARDLGCSPDEVTSPDLRVTVLIDGQPAIQTIKAQDSGAPLYAQLDAVATPSAPVQVQVKVEEAEPTGFFFTSTAWIPCDTDPGSASTYTFSWDGSLRSVTARGNDGNAAEAVVVFGPGAPAAPQVVASGLQPTSATLSWDAAPSASHRVTWGGLGAEVAQVPAGTSAYTMTGLCDNVAYPVRVVRDLDPWHVGSSDLVFRTVNVAPTAPSVVEAKAGNGSIAVDVYLPTSHDLDRIEVFGGPTPDVSTTGTPMASDAGRLWVGTVHLTAQGTAAYVKARVTDSGGLSAVSPAFQVGAPKQASGLPDPCVVPPPAPVAPASPPATPVSTTTTSGSQAGSTDSAHGALGHGGTHEEPQGGATTVTVHPDPSIPVNPMTITVAVGIAALLGIVIGLLVRRR